MFNLTDKRLLILHYNSTPKKNNFTKAKFKADIPCIISGRTKIEDKKDSE